MAQNCIFWPQNEPTWEKISPPQENLRHLQLHHQCLPLRGGKIFLSKPFIFFWIWVYAPTSQHGDVKANPESTLDFKFYCKIDHIPPTS